MLRNRAKGELLPQETFSSQNADRTASLRQQQQPPYPLPLRSATVLQGPKPVLAPPMSPCTSKATQDLSSCTTRFNYGAKCYGIRAMRSIQSRSYLLPTNCYASLLLIRSQLGEQLGENTGITGKEHAIEHDPLTPFFLNLPLAPCQQRATRMLRLRCCPTTHTPCQCSVCTRCYQAALATGSVMAPNPVAITVKGRTSRTSRPLPCKFHHRPNEHRQYGDLTEPFVCKFAGCNAVPFQTQYSLNSHANVHSSAQPHYCAVKGCPRSEGGKGFKRKNEMIRHGLVRESPGYVCPFCPDREHKYPRPDNLQRHVLVHHVDKDKDDPLLRDVLSQRPDGPNRGRRRRGRAHRDFATLHKETSAYTDHSFTTSSLVAQASNPPALHSTRRTVLGYAKYVYCDTDLRGLTFVAFVL
ncbi:hypothetical protein PG994_004251 [Apiospora phragmitis]|uniref:C2H2-type domain-containing protein n=1 Tax=Apiospora phragmitis TaxID=2905665 RepID=A0ABR1VQ74_9PEZI